MPPPLDTPAPCLRPDLRPTAPPRPARRTCCPAHTRMDASRSGRELRRPGDGLTETWPSPCGFRPVAFALWLSPRGLAAPPRPAAVRAARRSPARTLRVAAASCDAPTSYPAARPTHPRQPHALTPLKVPACPTVRTGLPSSAAASPAHAHPAWTARTRAPPAPSQVPPQARPRAPPTPQPNASPSPAPPPRPPPSLSPSPPTPRAIPQPPLVPPLGSPHKQTHPGRLG